MDQILAQVLSYQAPVTAYLSQFPLLVRAYNEAAIVSKQASILAPDVIRTLFASALFQLLVLMMLAWLVAQLVLSVLRFLFKHGIKGSLFLTAITVVRAIPFGHLIIKKQQGKVRDKIRKSILEAVDLGERHSKLPLEPMASDALLKQLRQWKTIEDENWKSGKVSGAVYLGEDKIKEVVNQAYSLFALTNPLHPELFPYVRKMEAEVVRMTVSLFNGSDECCGTMTSGGTESILMAIKAYRERGYSKGISKPELIIPVTAHAAFLKACDYFCIKPVMVPIDPVTFRVNMKSVKRNINSNTIALVGSAPGFPHGVIDPIEELAALARSWDIGLHVDCCLGSFLLPIVAQMPEYKDKVAPFDFRVPGVTSISCDPHKYGFTPKGTSVVMYASQELRRFQFFVAPDWTGGIYASPSIAGSRSGAVIAGAWATMMSLGHSGYAKIVKNIMSTRDKIIAAIESDMPELMICGTPESSVFAFMARDSKKLDVYKIQEAMRSKGWHLNALQYPRSVHLCVTNLQVGKHDMFTQDLKDSVTDVVENPSKYKDGQAAVYGMAESIPDRSLVSDMTTAFLDTLYEV